MKTRWIFIIGALLIAAAVALLAFNACIGPVTYGHFGWHPMGFGFLFMPVFMLLCLLIGGTMMTGAGHRHRHDS